MVRIIWAVVIILIIIGAYFFSRGDGEISEPTTPAPSQETITADNAVNVESQKPGTEVIVGTVILENPGYVVIHEDANEAPGSVIGNSNLLATRNDDVVVELERQSKAGETLYAMLHTDDGDGIYEFPGDDVPLKDEAGKIILAKFTISSQVSVSIQAGNFFFSPDILSVSKGDEVTVNIQNSGFHTFTVDELGVNETLRSDQETVTFTANKSGTFEYYCAVPGHRERGMFGSLTVE